MELRLSSLCPVPSLFIPNQCHISWKRKRTIGYHRKELVRSARRLYSPQEGKTTGEQLQWREQNGLLEKTKRVFSLHLACHRYYGASGIWGSPFVGNRWRDAEAWIHHGSVYDWRGPGGPYNWTRKNRQQKRELQIKDLYAILNVPKDASMEQIKRAFRRKIIRLHPDVNSLHRLNNQWRDLVCELVSAYRVLRDPTSRAEYDRNLMNACHDDDDDYYYYSDRIVMEERSLPISEKQVMSF